MRKKYLFRPLKHNLEVSSPSFNQPFPYASWPTQNVEIWQNSINKRPGYVADVNLGEGVVIQQIIYYQNSAGATATVFQQIPMRVCGKVQVHSVISLKSTPLDLPM